MKQLLTITFFSSILNLSLISQNILFNNTTDLSTQHIEQTASGISTLDGGFIIASSFGEFQEDDDSVSLIKYDKFGCIEWNKFHQPYHHFIDGLEKYYENSIRQFPDSSYIALISINNPEFSNNNSDLGLAKFDSKGNFLWANIYGWSDRWETGRDLMVLPDGGAVMVGSTDQWTIVEGMDWYQRLGAVIRVDSLGNELWRYQHDELSVFSSVCLDSQENIVITGGSGPFVDSVSNIIKISLTGEILKTAHAFARTSGEYDNSTYAITPSINGGFICTGRQIFTTNGDDAYFVYKIDENFELEWLFMDQRDYPLNESNGIIELDNGEIIVGGLKDDFDDEYLQIGWLAKFSSNGQKIWEKTYTAPQDGEYFQYNHPIYNIEKTKDNKIFTTGWTTQYIDGAPQINTKLWIMKLDEDGNNTLPLEAAFISQENNKICLGDSLQLSVLVTSTTGCYQSSWEGENLLVLSDEMAVFKPDSAGIYTFKCSVVDQSDQVVELTTEIEVLDAAMLLLTEDQDSINIGELFSVSEDCGMVWSGTAASYVVCLENNAYFLAPQEGIYELTVNSSDDFSCIEEQSFSLTVVDTMNTSINELTMTKTHLFPNPASTKINIQTNLPKPAQIYIYNSQGKLIKTAFINSGDVLTNIEVSQWTAGLYFYQLISNDDVSLESGKFLVQH